SRGRLHHVPGAIEIGVDDRVPAFDGDVERRLAELAARIVDQAVQPAPALPGVSDGSGTLLRIAYVQLAGRCLASGLPDQLASLLQQILPPAADQDFRPDAGEPQGDFPANARAASGNDSGLPGEK